MASCLGYSTRLDGVRHGCHRHTGRRHRHVRPRRRVARKRVCRRLSGRALLRDLSAPNLSAGVRPRRGRRPASRVACVVRFWAAMLRPSLSDPGLLRCLAYAAASLTIVRMVPVFIALYRTRLGWATSAFIGWFGPRGLASVVFALLASDELGGQADTLLTVVSVTVACSIILHGVSANPLIARYGALADRRPPNHPLSRVSEVPTSRRSFGRIQSPGVRRAG
jgi:hypothetical protein